MLSDFMDVREGVARFDDAMKIASGKHDIVGIRVYDLRETELPDVGIVEMKDAETGRKIWFDTSSRKARQAYAQRWKADSEVIDKTLNRRRIDHVSVATDEDYVKSLIKLFAQR